MLFSITGYTANFFELAFFDSNGDGVGDQVLVIGDTAHERDWSTAAQAAGYLAAERYFA